MIGSYCIKLFFSSRQKKLEKKKVNKIKGKNDLRNYEQQFMKLKYTKKNAFYCSQPKFSNNFFNFYCLSLSISGLK